MLENGNPLSHTVGCRPSIENYCIRSDVRNRLLWIVVLRKTQLSYGITLLYRIDRGFTPAFEPETDDVADDRSPLGRGFPLLQLVIRPAAAAALSGAAPAPYSGSQS
ncbi:hypothetical protein F4X86_04525 [Candidatus Saccharibacteria bacterium]|nr:hypothetical protein [Candidatus Saccharibacteria bacterium]